MTTSMSHGASRPVPAPTLRQRVRVPERVSAILATCLDRPMSIVQAPAGYGKTSTVLQWLLDAGIDPAWHNSVAADADPTLLLSGLIRALSGYGTPGGDAAIAALAARDERRSFRTMLQPLFAELALSDASRVLVVDDVHHVATSETAMRALDEFLEGLPPSVHVILMSRSEIPLPGLPRALLDGRAGRIDADDLLLTADDIADGAAAVFGAELSPDESRRLFEITSGWGIALRLAVQMRATHPDLPWDDLSRAMMAGQSGLFTYLAAEVLHAANPGVEQFLRDTAVLEVLEPEVCALMSGAPHPSELIQSMSRMGLPVLKVGWSSYAVTCCCASICCRSLIHSNAVLRTRARGVPMRCASAGRRRCNTCVKAAASGRHWTSSMRTVASCSAWAMAQRWSRW